jgi:hypothetical protein
MYLYVRVVHVHMYVVQLYMYNFLFTGLQREKEYFSMCATREPGIIGVSDRSW